MKRNIFITFVVFGILTVGLVVRMYKLTNPLGDWHAWRQADTASVTREFLNNGVNLLTPTYQDISSIQTGFYNPDGFRYVEFPIFNVLHYGLIKAVPKISLEVAGRLVSIFAALGSCLFLFGIGKKHGGLVVGISAALFYAILPFNVYFTRVILPEPLTVFFVLASLFLIEVYDSKRNALILFASALTFSCALLLKPYVIFWGIPIALRIMQIDGIAALGKVRNYIALLLALAPLLVWRIWINESVHPIGVPFFEWAFNGDKIRFRPAFWRWIMEERLGIMILGVWGMIPFGFGLMTPKKRSYMYATLLAALSYVSVVATANVRHDYYQTLIVPAVCLTLGYGVAAMIQGKQRIRGFLVATFCIGLGIGLSFFEIRGNYQVNHFEYVLAGEAVDRIAGPKDLVIAPNNGDTTFLYHTKRRGWPVLDRSVDELRALGAHYYVSTNNDKDTADIANRFKTVEKTDRFVIIDLTQPL